MMTALQIIVVDDDEDLLRLIQRFLVLQGNEVETFTSPLLALERVRQKKFDIALIDLVMPEMDGLELLHKLRQFDPLQQVIVITGYGSLPRAVTALEEGAADFLLKPFETLDELAEAISLCKDKQQRWQKCLRNIVVRQKEERRGE